MLDILRREQTELNNKFVAEGSITSVNKGVQLVVTVEVKQNNIAFCVMLNITNQHKTSISVRCIIGAEEPLTSHVITDVAKHALEVVDDLGGSGPSLSVGANKARVYVALKIGDDVFGSPIKVFRSPVLPSGLRCLNDYQPQPAAKQ